MANVLKIKSRQMGVAGAPSKLARAELAYDELGQIIYIGHGDGVDSTRSKKAIGGVGAFIDLASPQTLTNKTLTGGTYSGNGAGLTDLNGSAVASGEVPKGQLPKLNGITIPDGAVAMNSQKITGLAAPEADSDAATMEYVDDAAAGLRESFTTTIESGNTHYDIEHNLGRHPIVQVFEGDSPGVQLDCEITHVSTTTTRLTFAGTSPTTATAEFR